MRLNKSPWTPIFAALALAGIYVIYLLVSADEADEDWGRFVAEHNCQSVGVQTGNNRGGWRCDDDKIHYCWRQQK